MMSNNKKKGIADIPSIDNEAYKPKAAWDLKTTQQLDAVATRRFAWAPSSGILPNGIDENDDVYHPCFENGCIDLEEGSGDSEEISGGSTGASAELRNINLSTSQGNGSEMGNGKRVGRCDSIERKKKFKVPASEKIADAISRIASAFESRSAVVNTLVVPGASIGEVMAELQRMEAITSDLDWHS